VFEGFDLDGDGVVSRKEMRAGLLSFGIRLTDDELDTLVGYYDTDHSGQVNRPCRPCAGAGLTAAGRVRSMACRRRSFVAPLRRRPTHFCLKPTAFAFGL
jgi:hypothetical protein